MSKRFTDTNKWKQRWLCEADPKLKLLWLYMCDECDGVGIWEINFKLATASLGFDFDFSDLEKIGLGTRIIKISDDKVWMPGFITFQYKTLKIANPTQRSMMKNIVSSVAKLNLEGETKELIDTFILALINDPRNDPHIGGHVDPTGNGYGKGSLKKGANKKSVNNQQSTNSEQYISTGVLSAENKALIEEFKKNMHIKTVIP